MANPTQYYSWSYPTQNQDPWFTTFDTFASAIDAAVHSVDVRASSLEAESPGRMTLVLSHFANNNAMGISSATATIGSPILWTILSSAPTGRLSGAFTVVASGAQVLTSLTGYIYSEATGAITANTILHFFRVIVNPGSLVIGGNSAFVAVHNIVGVFQPFHFQSVDSFAPNAYTTELQARVNANGAASRMICNGNGWITLTTNEGGK